MLSVLKNPSYAKLFSAQVIALIGTGLLTVALGLFAYDIAGDQGGVVMGVAMTIKMLAYVGVTPVVSALTARLPRKTVLIAADVVRAAVALALPWVSEAWHIYALIFLLQSASATFTPTFQALIPSVLPAVRDYTKALSLSRLAYDMEALASPLLAVLLLQLVDYHQLFFGTVAGFVISALLVLITRLPGTVAGGPQRSFAQRLTGGIKLFWTRRELRGLLALNLVDAAVTAMVIVNTVVIAQSLFGRDQSQAALLLAANGTGSLLVAFAMVPLLDRFNDRAVMKVGATALPLALLLGAAVMFLGSGDAQWVLLLAVWFLIGASTALTLTPSSRLLQRNSTDDTRQEVYSAQFSLSHAAFLLTYPLAGFLGSALGMPATALILAGVALAAMVLLRLAWAGLQPRIGAPVVAVEA
ncbi:MFS transporter [Galactobacter caseinivorans]|uniref:MFS transporter n=1 Tax=Galactobacter caseinivorans TaxID=2676123 RepID=A0A496PIR6_9MICC|nr:MFS transporter [Galactobacter caseinivorans]RKW70385.1 MFS transporter [Galactobacter caseinivorans]